MLMTFLSHLRSLTILQMCVLVFLVGISGHVFSASKLAVSKPTIVVSIKPIALIVRDLLGESAYIEVLIDGPSSAHHYQMKMSDRKKLANADTVIWIGESMERFLKKPLSQREKQNKPTLTLEMLVANLINMSAKPILPNEHNHHAQHMHSGSDLHLWLSPVVVDQLYIEIAKQLKNQFPDLAPAITINAHQARKKLEAIYIKWMPYFKLHGTHFIAFHSSFDHFARAFNLPEPASLTSVPDEAIGFKKISALMSEPQSKHKCLVVDLPEVQQGEKFAKKLGLSLVEVDLLAIKSQINNGYAGFYQQFLNDLSRCFESSLKR